MGRLKIERWTGLGAALAASACIVALGASSSAAAAPPGWSSQGAPDSGHTLAAVTCASASLCVGVDTTGGAISSTTPAAPTPNWQRTAAAAGALSGVSCPQGQICVAVGAGGSVSTAVTPATSWTAVTPAIDGARDLRGVSCPNTGLCLATDGAGNVLVSFAPASAPTWSTMHLDATNALNGISCPTATLCAAVDSAGNVLVSTSPTAAASWQSTSLGAGALTAISCTSSALCVAVGSDGSVHATANATAVAPTWSATPLDPPGPLNAVSCSEAGLCVVVDNTGHALESDNPASGPPSWTPATIDAGKPVTGVSCLAAGFCLAVAAGDAILATVPAPVVSTAGATVSSQSTATLAATVDPGDATLTDCHFDYGVSATYGSTAPCATAPHPGGGVQAVSAPIAGLTAGTVYHFRIAASNAVAGTAGADANFTTPTPLKPAPSLSGTPAVGSTLTCKPNVTVPAPLVTTYAWLRDTVPIDGAALPTYLITPTDATHHLSCQVTITGDGGTATASSAFNAVPAQSGNKIIESVVGTAKDSATSVRAPVTCSPQVTGRCTVTLTLTSIETVRHQRQTVTIGSSSTQLLPGKTRTLVVSLDATGKAMLKAHRRLTVTLTVRGTVIGKLVATLKTARFVLTAPAKTHAPRRRR